MLCEWFLSVLALLWLGSPRGRISLPKALMDLLLTEREGVLWKRWGHSVSVAQVQAFQLVVDCFYGSLWAKNPNSPGTPTKKGD